MTMIFAAVAPGFHSSHPESPRVESARTCVLNALSGAASVGLQGVAHMAYHYFLFFLGGIAWPYLGITSISRLIYLSLYIATGRKFSRGDVLDLSKKQNIIFV